MRDQWLAIEQGSDVWQLPELDGTPGQAELHIEVMRRSDDLPAIETITDVLARYQDHISLNRLRQHWIQLAMQNDDWNLIVQLYRPGDNTASECSYRLARTQTGVDQPRSAHRLYVNGAQGRSCQRFLTLAQSKDWISDWSRSERVKVLLTQNRFGEAIELARSLGPKNTQRAEAYALARQDPSGYLARYPNGESRTQAIRSLIGQDPTGAARWIRAQDTDLREWQAVHFILDDHPDTATVLESLRRPLKTRSLREWEIRYHLRHQRWMQVAQRIDELPASLGSSSAWQYWRGMAAAQLNQPNPYWRGIAKRLDYYGMLAADQLNQPYATLRPNHSDAGSVAALLNRYPVQIAKALLDAGLDSRARSQWRWVFNQFKLSEKQAATELAQQWGWSSEEVRGAVNSRQTDTLHMYPDALRRVMQNREVDEDWLLGLTRTESLFQIDVRSRAGALGLMQIMPATGKKQAQRMGIPWQGSATLVDPQVNVNLGSDYLAQMYQQFGYNALVASAAYNAGPNAVQRWLNQPDMDPAIWVETIPFKETRNYVKKVMAAATIYNQALGGRDRRLSDRMTPLPKN